MKAMTVFRACAAVAAFSMVTALFADGNFSWKGEGGVVTVPAGGAAITDADIADVEALTSIVLADATSVVTAEGLASPLNLSAAISGPGALTFASCAGVTVAGDNSSLTGTFNFNDTPVLVTSRYGLGGENTPSANFTKGTNGTLSFSGNGLTNDVPLHITGEIDLPNGTDELFHQRGDIILTGERIWFRNVEVEEGLVGNTSYSFFLTVRPDCKVTLRPDVSIRANSSGGGLLYFMGELNKPLTGVIRLETGTIDARAGMNHFNYVDILELGVENTFAETATLKSSLSNKDGGLDLCGRGQSFACIVPASAPTQASTDCQTVRSADPATLTFTDTTERAVTMPFKFSGAASFTYAGNGSYTIVNQLSDTTGDLTVSSGTVTFDWNAGWGTGDVTVDGGELVCNSPQTLTAATGRLVVSGEGRLTVAAGVTLKVASAKVGAVELQKGVEYAKADLDELGCGDFFSGEGLISVADDGSEFVWPEAPGGKVTVPVNKQVEVRTAEDAAKVQAYAELKLSSGSRVTVQNLTDDFVLSAALSGNGEFVAANLPKIVLAGDNSNLGEGGFAFTDCGVIVSNRYGLGGAATRYADFTKGDNGFLTFGGEGVTNDVPLHLHAADMNFPEGTDEPFWQNADVELYGVGNSFNLRPGNVTFLSGCLHSNCSLFYLLPRTGCTVTFETDSALKASSYFYTLATVKDNVGGTVVFNTSDVSYGAFLNYTYTVHTTLGLANVLSDSVRLTICPSKVDFGIDLLADQTVPHINFEQVTIAKEMTVFATVNGLRPATLTMTDMGAAEVVGPLKFSGEAGLTINGPGSYRIVKQVSDTTGPLNVLAGTLTFDWGAGWGGTNVTIGANGTLAITADSSGVGLYTEDGARRNTLVVENGGTLDLAENVCVTSHWAKANGEWLKRGVYGGTEAGLDAAHTLPFITGRGRLAVRKSYGSGLMLIFR